MKSLQFLFLAAIVLASCGRSSGSGSQSSDAADSVLTGSSYSLKLFMLSQEKLPKSVDLSTDISTLSYQELMLLRNYVYATHGLWFMDEEMNQFFQRKCDWYEATCYEYLEAHDWNALTDMNQVKLSKEEADFVGRINERMKQMEQFRTLEPDNLLNPSLTVNMFQLDTFSPLFYEKLGQNNFALIPTDKQQLFNIYEMNSYHCIPNYITTDVYLQAFHMYFSYVLKYLERRMFTDRLFSVCKMMNSKAMQIAGQSNDESIRNSAEYCAAFYCVAERLLSGTQTLPVPEAYRQAVEVEVGKILAEKPAPSAMMPWRNGMEFPYDLYRPRGHYTRSEAEQRYFRAMMWLQTCTFCRESTTALQHAAMMAYIINTLTKEESEPARSISETLEFLIGEPDNVSIYDVATTLREGPFHSLSDLNKEENLQWLSSKLQPYCQSRNRIRPKVEDPECRDKINFMPQRYTPDAEILSQMYDPTRNAQRAFPSGLDVFAAFGVQEASHIINNVYKAPGQWKDYKATARKMSSRFGEYTGFGASMYTRWIETLVELQKEDKQQPAYMQTQAWKHKNLNTALASWTELKHDAILYGEQPLAAECGGGSEFPDPILVGYIEPNLPFWNKLKELLGQTRSLLDSHELMDQQLNERTERLEEYIDFCIRISQKELAGETLEETEYAEIRYLGSSLEWFTLSVLDPDLELDSWSLVQGPDRSVAQVADVFTRNIPDCKKCGILYEAVGTPDAIYVLVDIGGRTVLTRGATFSYYEFVNPLGQRLTDEEWQQRLEKGDIPGRPQWMNPYIIDKKPVVNEEIFYSTGC